MGNFNRYKQLSVEKIMTKSMALIEHAIDDETLPKAIRLDIASRFVLKYIPQIIENNSTVKVLNMNETLTKRLEYLLSLRQAEHLPDPSIPIALIEGASSQSNDE